MTRPHLRTGLLFAVLTAVVALGAWAWTGGVRLSPVLTGSMQSSYPAGSLVLTAEAPASSVRAGDVIAFRPPPPYVTSSGRPVLHRVVTARVLDGRLLVTTRGDANPAADPWTLDLTGARIHRAHGSVPFVGRGVAAVVSPRLAVRAASVAGLLLLAGAVLVSRRPVATEDAPC